MSMTETDQNESSSKTVSVQFRLSPFARHDMIIRKKKSNDFKNSIGEIIKVRELYMDIVLTFPRRYAQKIPKLVLKTRTLLHLTGHFHRHTYLSAIASPKTPS